MAIYHLSAQVIKRSEGRSSVACASYRCGYDLTDDRLGETFSFKRKDRVTNTYLMLPPMAPDRFRDRGVLWNEVEAVEKRKDAQLAREFNVALPNELSDEENVLLAQEFCQKLVDRGMIVDLCIHNLGEEDAGHFHAQTTMRDVGPDGFGKKNRAWNSTEMIEEIRIEWQDICNAHLKKAGHDIEISHKSHEDNNIDREPQIHHYNNPVLIEKNRAIIESNNAYSKIKTQITRLKKAASKAISGFLKTKSNEEKPSSSAQIEYGGQELKNKNLRDDERPKPPTRPKPNSH